MKQYKVLMTEPAADDLQLISGYVADELFEPATAKKLIGKIKETVISLADMPTCHALVADERLAAQGIRKLIVENYIAFYVISEKDRTVTVIRMLYGRRDWEHLIYSVHRWEVDFCLGAGVKFSEVKEVLMKDEDFKVEYEKLKPRYGVISQIIEARTSQNITQEELALLIGTQKSNISRLESGTYNPSLDFLFKVARSLGKEVQIALK